MWFGTHTDVCIKNVHRDFPSGPVVTDSPGSVGDTCLISVWGAKTPHAMEEVSQSNTTRKPMPQLLSTRSSVQPLIRVRLFVTPWTAVRQASLSFTISWSLLKPMSIELVMPSNRLTLCCPLLFLPSIFPSIRVFFELALHIRWPKYWSFSISPPNEYSVLISSRIDWFDLLAVQGSLKSLL